MLTFCVFSSFAQQATGALRGLIADEFGAAIVGATVTATDEKGAAKTAVTNNEGVYVLSGLAPGKYSVRASATGFAASEATAVDVTSGRREPLNITLKVTIEEQKVTVAAETPLSTEPTNNADQVMLTGKDLDALPDDPDEMAAALQALAGPSVGPNGGQIFIDGFTGGRLPPKQSIREIRINQNPFAAENDQPAGGRIDIFTKPGTDKFRGSAFLNFNDESLNSRNPFATSSSKRPPFQLRQYGGNLSGPIVARKVSFFLDFERREIDDSELVRGTTLDSAFNPVPFGFGVQVPRRFITFSPRFDYQLNQKNTIVARYSYNHTSTENAGVTGFSLPERGFTSSFTQQTVQLTNTAVLTPTIINETRFQFIHQRSQQQGDNSRPTISVNEAFIGGGSQVGLSFNNENRYELQNYTSWSWGHHALKAGGRLRGVHIEDVSQNNFGGTFVFTSIEQYRQTLLGIAGARPAQFRINAGRPDASVSQVDVGVFMQDDWRLRPNLTLSLGLRYEAQTNISSKYNLAPRFAVAWSPGGGNSAKPPKTIIRGGAGIFYNRFSENQVLQAGRFNGDADSQQQFIVGNNLTDPTTQAILGGFPNVPSTAALKTLASQVTTWRIAPDLQAPAVYLFGGQVERQLPHRFTMFVGVFSFNIKHVIRARDINAPLLGSITLLNPNGVRPFGNVGEINQYESSGNFKLRQMFIGINNRLNPNITIFSNYVLSKTTNDTDGQGGGLFPANSYDLSGEFGRASFDVRHRFTLAGTVTLPWYRITLNPFIIATSGRPFNIIIGRDLNGDKQFTERPSFAGANADCNSFNIACTRFGNFNLLPQPGEQIIPRNFGEGPGFFSVNMRVSKTWSFGDLPGAKKTAASGSTKKEGSDQAAASGGPGSGPVGPRGVPGMGGGGPRGGGGIPGLGPGGLGGGASAEKRYGLTFSLNFRNLLNHTNPGPVIGNLSSRQLFGESVSLNGGFGGPGGGGGPGGSTNAGNRRVEAQVRFTF